MVRNPEMMNEPKVSVVIAVKSVNRNLEQCIAHCLELDYPDFEILVFPDVPSKVSYPKVKMIPTGAIGPAEKRDLSLRYAEGQILAFLDDDAYPKTNWLKQAVKHFKNPQVGAVGGPAITPQNNTFYQKASATVFESWVGAGQARLRYLPIGKLREIDDYPSVNLLVKKEIFEKIGGFNSTYWPGEDTKLCLEIIKNDRKIIYDPQVVVWHHRRPLFIPHLKQVWNYALHRGYFVKRFPQTSLKFCYFIPTLFIFGLIFGLIAALFNPISRILYFSVLFIYLFSTVLTAVQKRSLILVLTVPIGILATHFCYGIGFLRGLCLRRLKEETI